jgi:hypothetical protein
MSNRRRIFTAFAIFAIATSLLALAEAKKPIKVAVLKQKTQAAEPVEPKKPHAKKYLPVHHMSDY